MEQRIWRCTISSVLPLAAWPVKSNLQCVLGCAKGGREAIWVVCGGKMETQEEGGSRNLTVVISFSLNLHKYRLTFNLTSSGTV